MGGVTAEWIELLLGIWLIAAPWLLGFSGIEVMLWSNTLVGLFLLLANLWTIFARETRSL